MQTIFFSEGEYMQEGRERAEEPGGGAEAELGNCNRCETESDVDTRKEILSEAEQTHG